MLPAFPSFLARRGVPILSLVLAVGRLGGEETSSTASPPQAPAARIDVSGFRDSASHWRHIKEPNRAIQATPDQPVYTPEQVREIADNLLLFQRDSGGWPKDYDLLAILTDEQKAAVRASRVWHDTSFDNHSTHPEVRYLAQAFVVTENKAYREACLRGLDFMLAAQYENGGFPQRYPSPKGFHAAITFNDGVMIGILGVLREASGSQSFFSWLDDARRERCRKAVERGIACILKCQIKVDGALTAWGQQHDEKTFETIGARAFELASLCPQETTEIVRFLMGVEHPSKEILAATDAAVAWLKHVELHGIRVEKFKAEHAEFIRHDTDLDSRVVDDEKAPPLWARSYEVGTNRPIFASRDGIKVYSFGEMDRERRTGTPWYGDWPRKLIEKEYPAWRAQQEARVPAPARRIES